MKKFLFALMALVGIVACDNEPEAPVVRQTLQLSADNTQIYADGTQTATFSVKDSEGRAVEGATIYFANTNEALEGNTFKTKYVGTYTFYAQKDNDKSNTITIEALEVKEDTKVVTLAVTPATIVADGQSAAVFSTTCNGEAVEATVYNAADNTALTTNAFTTETAGEYTFYALYADVRSNDVKVTATAKEEPGPEPDPTPDPAKPITITASASTFKANGVDSVTFTVTEEGGADVTAQATIYANGGKLQGNKFATTTPGTYTIYAERGEMKSNEITVTAEEVTATGKSIVFADGVTMTSGWYDANKRGNGQTHGDTMMCWAASASNLLEWWQDRYQAAGNSLPAGAITGPGTTYELAIMELIKNQWTTLERGGLVFQAIAWYLEGINLNEYASAGTAAQPVGAGGYYASLMPEIKNHMYCGYSYLFYSDLYAGEITNYDIYGSGRSSTEILKSFSDIIVSVMDRGASSMIVSMSADFKAAHHAITLWGYEIDEATGLITRLWVTDSDDLLQDPKEQLLNEYNVSMSSQNTIQLEGDTRYNLWVVGLQPFAGYQK